MHFAPCGREWARDAQRGWIVCAPGELCQHCKEITSLRAELEAARADTDRLDWIAGDDCYYSDRFAAISDQMQYVRATTDQYEGKPSPLYLRELIDAAREEK